MEQANNIERAKLVLQFNLDWISRYDTRIALLAGIQIAMLGLLAKSGAAIISWGWISGFTFGTAFLAISYGLILVYLSQYPKTESQNSSLIYFGTIAPLKINNYKEKFLEVSENEYLDDLLSQVYINSIILSKKFDNLKSSLRLLAISIPPWLYAVYLSGILLDK